MITSPFAIILEAIFAEAPALPPNYFRLLAYCPLCPWSWLPIYYVVGVLLPVAVDDSILG